MKNSESSTAKVSPSSSSARPRSSETPSCTTHIGFSPIRKTGFLGFIACWELATCRYVEHLAVNDLLRGRGYGSRLLGDFVRAPGEPVLLEIDPVTDDVSAARLRFYQKCGFVENPYAHRHPPYRAGFAPHLLVVLTSGRAISEEEYQRFDDDLRNVVMNFHGVSASDDFL